MGQSLTGLGRLLLIKIKYSLLSGKSFNAHKLTLFSFKLQFIFFSEVLLDVFQERTHTLN